MHHPRLLAHQHHRQPRCDASSLGIRIPTPTECGRKRNSLGCHHNSTRFSDPRQNTQRVLCNSRETKGKPNADDAFDCFALQAICSFVKPALVAISFWVCGLSSRGTCPPRWRPSTSRWAMSEAHHQTSGTSIETSRATTEMCSEHNTKSSQSAPAILQAQSTTLACDSPPLFLLLSSCKPTSAHGKLSKDSRPRTGVLAPRGSRTVPLATTGLGPWTIVNGPQTIPRRPEG